ncbi:unnamed protein product [Malus baccata var. baccata]
MLLLPVNKWVLETSAFDFSGDDFLNFNLPPIFIIVSMVHAEKCSNIEFGMNGEHIKCSDEVDNFAKWDFAAVYDHYEGEEDVVEDHECEEVIWKDYSNVIILKKKRLMCAWSIGIWKILLLNWVLWNILVGHLEDR